MAAQIQPVYKTMRHLLFQLNTTGASPLPRSVIASPFGLMPARLGQHHHRRERRISAQLHLRQPRPAEPSGDHGGQQVYTITTTYDANSRVSTATDPSGFAVK